MVCSSLLFEVPKVFAPTVVGDDDGLRDDSGDDEAVEDRGSYSERPRVLSLDEAKELRMNDRSNFGWMFCFVRLLRLIVRSSDDNSLHWHSQTSTPPTTTSATSAYLRTLSTIWNKESIYYMIKTACYLPGSLKTNKRSSRGLTVLAFLEGARIPIPCGAFDGKGSRYQLLAS